MKLRVDERLKRALVVRGFHLPLFEKVVIELQSHCNRTCYFCSRESDRSGKRKSGSGEPVMRSLPTPKALALLDELVSLQFKGHITFHQLSEPFLDKRLLPLAREALRRGMRPYVHTNGDVLRSNKALCREAADVFEYIVVGLYDYESPEERDREERFWRQRLGGTDVRFSLVENVYPRTHSLEVGEMAGLVRHTYPSATCSEPLRYLFVHYDGQVACCCEDMHGELLKQNVFDHSLREIWYSARHREIVKRLQKGARTEFALCARCTKNPNRYSLPRVKDDRR